MLQALDMWHGDFLPSGLTPTKFTYLTLIKGLQSYIEKSDKVEEADTRKKAIDATYELVIAMQTAGKSILL